MNGASAVWLVGYGVVLLAVVSYIVWDSRRVARQVSSIRFWLEREKRAFVGLDQALQSNDTNQIAVATKNYLEVVRNLGAAVANLKKI